MCGIVGYIGNKNVERQLIESLKLLEYRGYDSAGVAVSSEEKIWVKKVEGKISRLEKMLEYNENVHLGIAHTRWATHGKPTAINAHPHVSENKRWAVVHNGIIENFGHLKSDLQEKGVNFVSETDTEVIAHLLEHHEKVSKIETLINVCKKLKGSFALAVINGEEEETLYLAKRKSPLYIAQNQNEIFIASDPICFAGKSNSYYSLEDNEYAMAQIDNVVFYNSSGEEISKVPTYLNEMEANFGKQEYEHFMLKEIEEVPSVLKRLEKTYRENSVFQKLDSRVLRDINKIILVGCGTAYHAGLMGESYIEKFARIESHCYIASEFRYSDPIIDEKTLAIFVSQSGETADTIMAHELARQKGAKTIALTNVLYSTLAKKADYILPVCAGPEIAVASTKAYTAQIAILNMLAKYLGNVKNGTVIDYLHELSTLASEIKIPKEEELASLSNELSRESIAFFIGRGVDYITAEEASLKLKEISYINSQSYPSGELKHGFLALVTQGTYVIVVATQKDLLDKTLNGAYEASARGAKLVIVTQFDIPESDLQDVHDVIKLQTFEEDLMPISSIGLFQMLGYLTSIKKGVNPDQPRNLAKSVTVE